MAKEDLLTLEGQIDEILPDGRFGVVLENDPRIICYTAGKMRKLYDADAPAPGTKA